MLAQLAPTLADRLLYTFNGLCPSALPPAVRQIADRRGHHVLVSVGDYGGGERARFDGRLRAFVARRGAAAVDVLPGRGGRRRGTLKSTFLARGEVQAPSTGYVRLVEMLVMNLCDFL